MGKQGVVRYKVDIQGLSNGVHQFEFPIDSRFFERIENSPVSQGNLVSHISLTKTETFINVLVKIDGTIELVCDKSLDLFDYPISLNREVIFKYGEDFQELDDNILQIPSKADSLNLLDLFYEFIVLEIPMRKVHPRYSDEGDEDSLFYSTEIEEEESTNEETDPRWSALKDISKKKK